MALNASKCNHQMPLPFKGLTMETLYMLPSLDVWRFREFCCSDPPTRDSGTDTPRLHNRFPWQCALL